MTTHTDGRFTGAAGGQIYWQGWVPDDEPAGIVVISHGFAEHSGRYAHVAERLATEGYACYAVDHRGHGQSEGRRGNLNRMSEVCADLGQVIALASERHDGLPLVLLGHSLGGLIALDYVTSSDQTATLCGLILSGAVMVPSVGSKVERLAAKVLSSIAPNLGLVPPLDSSTISRDPDVVTAYDADPLNYRGKIGARVGAEALAAIDRVTGRLSTISLPVLVLHGTDDQLSAPSGSQLVADRVASQDVTLTLHDGLYHEIFNEPEQQAVLDEVVGWLKKHC